MIRLSTLGQLSIQVGPTTVPATNAQVIAALLFLTVERGKPASRRLLTEMFFADSDADAAAHSCRQLVYRLRKIGVDSSGDGAVVTLPGHAATWDVEEALARDTLSASEVVTLQRG